jgi:hypothetical protein
VCCIFVAAAASKCILTDALHTAVQLLLHVVVDQTLEL